MDQIPAIASSFPLLPASQRIAITPTNIPLLLTPGPPILLLVYLSRRPNTLLLRLAILPFAAFWCIYLVTGFRWMSMDMAPWNFALGLWSLMALAKTVEFSTNTTGFRRLDEVVPAVDSKPTNGNAKSNGHGSTDSSPPSHRAVQNSPGLYDASTLLCALRGIGWEHGEGTYVPPFPYPTTPPSSLRRAWLTYAFLQFNISFLLMDALECLIKLHPNFGNPGPASMFIPTLGPLARYTLSTATHLATGLAIIAGFQSTYYFVGFICVLLLGQSPNSWPPIQEYSWLATSLHDFWAKRWHQLLRRPFLVMGGYPMQFLVSSLFGEAAGEVAIVFGVFLASGALHALAQTPIGLPLDWTSVLFFGAQGVGIGCERIWKMATGRRVEGVWGWCWAFFWVVGLGQIASEGWHQHGLGAGIVIPPVLSPVRMIIWPGMKLVWERLRT